MDRPPVVASARGEPYDDWVDRNPVRGSRRRRVPLVLTGVVVLALAACGGDPDSGSDSGRTAVGRRWPEPRVAAPSTRASATSRSSRCIEAFEARDDGGQVDLFRAPTGELNARVAADVRSGRAAGRRDLGLRPAHRAGLRRPGPRRRVDAARGRRDPRGVPHRRLRRRPPALPGGRAPDRRPGAGGLVRPGRPRLRRAGRARPVRGRLGPRRAGLVRRRARLRRGLLPRPAGQRRRPGEHARRRHHRRGPGHLRRRHDHRQLRATRPRTTGRRWTSSGRSPARWRSTGRSRWPPTAPTRDVAKDFISFVVGEEGQTVLGESGAYPTLPGVAGPTIPDGAPVVVPGLGRDRRGRRTRSSPSTSRSSAADRCLPAPRRPWPGPAPPSRSAACIAVAASALPLLRLAQVVWQESDGDVAGVLGSAGVGAAACGTPSSSPAAVTARGRADRRRHGAGPAPAGPARPGLLAGRRPAAGAGARLRPRLQLDAGVRAGRLHRRRARAALGRPARARSGCGSCWSSTPPRWSTWSSPWGWPPGPSRTSSAPPGCRAPAARRRCVTITLRLLLPGGGGRGRAGVRADPGHVRDPAGARRTRRVRHRDHADLRRPLHRRRPGVLPRGGHASRCCSSWSRPSASHRPTRSSAPGCGRRGRRTPRGRRRCPGRRTVRRAQAAALGGYLFLDHGAAPGRPGAVVGHPRPGRAPDAGQLEPGPLPPGAHPPHRRGARPQRGPGRRRGDAARRCSAGWWRCVERRRGGPADGHADHAHAGAARHHARGRAADHLRPLAVRDADPDPAGLPGQAVGVRAPADRRRARPAATRRAARRPGQRRRPAHRRPHRRPAPAGAGAARGLADLLPHRPARGHDVEPAVRAGERDAGGRSC